jgi:hypothetical protein
LKLGSYGEGAGLGAEHGDLGVGEQVGGEAVVDGGGDRSGGLADDDLGGVRIVLGEVAERRRPVDVSLVLDGQLQRVLTGLYALMRGWRARIDATGRCCHGVPQRRRSRSR